MRPAARLVALARGHRAEIWLRMGSRVANLRSILSVMGLCAIMGTTLEVEATGDDEESAIRAVETVFGDEVDELNDVADAPPPLTGESDHESR